MGDVAWERKVAERLGSIEAKLDNIVTRLPDHGKRLSALERWRAYILGALAVISIGLIAIFKLG